MVNTNSGQVQATFIQDTRKSRTGLKIVNISKLLKYDDLVQVEEDVKFTTLWEFSYDKLLSFFFADEIPFTYI